MTVIPCQRNPELAKRIDAFSEILKTQAHLLSGHGLSEQEFYNSGLFRGVIERIRGQFIATMGEKREFVRDVLNFMQDHKFIKEWESSGGTNRHDYTVSFDDGRNSVIELKGCLDGNNTNIFERPQHAHEFIIWSVCTNLGANPIKNVWSGIHTRLGAEMISNELRVDGLIVWDMRCGTIGRPCPKITAHPERTTTVSHFALPPPCLYVFPATTPAVKNNPHPPPQSLESVRFLKALHDCFGGLATEVNYVDFEVAYQGSDIMRTTRVTRDGALQQGSKPKAIRRT